MGRHVGEWDATLVNGAAWGSGQFGGGVALTSSADYVDVPSGVLDGVGDTTIALWVQTTGTGQQAIVSGANASNNNELLVFMANDTQIRFYTGSKTGRAWGMIKVKARIGNSEWDTTIWPDKASGSFLLPVKAAVRKAEKIDAGDQAEVNLTVLTSPGI